MSRIRIMPEILSNKIAAGEVVERPASVVKELVENSLDAKSKRIHIDIGRGGRSLIRISDNGIGMSPDDALLAIERYATSKIYDDSDLFSIKTLGFRGEALPSIASVCKFSLISRSEESDSATHVLIEGGKIKNVTETGAPKGTMISVEQLFFNTPARRKFLKTINTEMGHIGDTVTSIALGWPDVQFRLTHNGKNVKSWPAVKNPFDRAVDVLGKDLKGNLHPVNFEDDYLKISGWTSSPQVTRSTSQKIYIYINGRYIRDRGLQHALFEGYRGRLMKGRFPLAVLFIDLPFDQLDVNVHPTKHEVKFAEQRRVFGALKSSVTWTLEEAEKARWSLRNKDEHSEVFSEPAHNSPEPDRPETEPRKNSIVEDNREWVSIEDVAEPVEIEDEISDSITEPEKVFEAVSEYQESRAGKDVAREPSVLKRKLAETGEGKSAKATELPFEAVNTKPEQEELFEKKFFRDLTVIGQLHTTYIICSSEEGLILLDQHAAHERVRYEELKEGWEKGGGSVQKLLVPEVIDFSYREAAVVEEMIPDLGKIGVEVEPFGGNTFVVKSVPSILAEAQIGPLLTEISEKMVEEGFTPGLEKAIDECLILMACHGSIRAHQSLSAREIELLLEQLDGCDNPSTCPHGRPTWIQWTQKELEKAFSRIV